MALKQVLDESGRERLTLVTGPRRLRAYLKLAGSVGLGGFILWGFLYRREDGQLLSLLVAAGVLAAVVAWLWRDLSAKDLTVTLTRGRVEVRQGAWSRSWTVRDFRFVQLGHQAYPSKHLTLHTVSLWLVLDRADGSRLLELLRYEQEEWLEAHAEQYARVDAALARLGLRERPEAPRTEG